MKTIYHIAPKRSGHVFVANMIKSWCPDDTLVDLENLSPAHFRPTSGEFVIVLQIRDLLNWYASYMQDKKFGGVKILRATFDLVQEFYQPQYLKKYKVVRVFYDDFFSGADYRKRVCAELDGVYNEKMLNTVMDNGKGSSFSGIEMDGKAQDMPVLTRYKMISPSKYKALYRRYPGLIKLYLQHTTDIGKIDFINNLYREHNS